MQKERQDQIQKDHISSSLGDKVQKGEAGGQGNQLGISAVPSKQRNGDQGKWWGNTGLAAYSWGRICKTANNGFAVRRKGASSSHSCLPTTPHFTILQQDVAVEGREDVPLVSYLFREKDASLGLVLPCSSRLGWLGTHLGIVGTAEGQQHLGSVAGGSSGLRMVLQSLGDDPYKQEDLQSLQGLVIEEREVYPAPAQTSI